MKLFDPREIMQSLEAAVSEELQATATRTLTAIVQATPVGDPSLWKSPAPIGYKPGHAVFNWHCSIENVSNAELAGFDTTRSATIARERRTVDQWSRQLKRPLLHIQNGVPYIERLNDGWSSQAPAGFVEKAALAANSVTASGRRELE